MAPCGSGRPAAVNSASNRSVSADRLGPRYARPAWPSTVHIHGWRSAVARKESAYAVRAARQSVPPAAGTAISARTSSTASSISSSLRATCR